MKRLLLFALFLASPVIVRAQDPGAAQDAEAARQKLLRAADQIEVIQASGEANAAQVTTLKAEIEQQRMELDATKAQLATLKADNASLREALEKLDAARAAERKALLDEVAKIVADAGKSQGRTTPRAETHEKAEAPAAPAPKGDAAQKGYEYVVAKGDTLSSISAAYQAQGVHASVADIRKANTLSNGQMLHVGQKLFIPKP
jgi:LysM repeat protein